MYSFCMLSPYELPPIEEVMKHTDVFYDELVAIADGCNASGSYKVLARRLFAEIEDGYNSLISIQHLTNLLEHIAYGKLTKACESVEKAERSK